MHELATWAASGLSLAATCVSVAVTLRNTAQPHPASWLVRACTDTVMPVLQLGGGARVPALILIPEVAGII